jgi:hypothetical protein
MAQLAQRFRLKLPHPLARDAQHLPYLPLIAR